MLLLKLAAANPAWQATALAALLPVLGIALARWLGVVDLFRWRALTTDPASRLALASTLFRRPHLTFSPQPGRAGALAAIIRHEEQSALILAATTLRHFDATPQIIRALLDETADALIRRRRRARRFLIAVACALPLAGILKSIRTAAANDASNSLLALDFSIVAMVGLACGLFLLCMVALGIGMVRRADRTDLQMLVDAEVIALTGELVAQASTYETGIRCLLDPASTRAESSNVATLARAA